MIIVWARNDQCEDPNPGGDSCHQLSRNFIRGSINVMFFLFLWFKNELDASEDYKVVKFDWPDWSCMWVPTFIDFQRLPVAYYEVFFQFQELPKCFMNFQELPRSCTCTQISTKTSKDYKSSIWWGICLWILTEDLHGLPSTSKVFHELPWTSKTRVLDEA